MKKTLTLLVASTALTAAIGVPAWSAMQAAEHGARRPFTAFLEESLQAMPIILASDDDDDDRPRQEGVRRGHDDDDDEDDDCDDDEDDDCQGSAGNPAPAGSVPPPQNGLFGNGAPPQVQMN